LRKDDAALLVDYADALGVQNQHSLNGKPMALIKQALQLEPTNLKALALAGTDAFVRQDFDLAVRYWSQVEKIGPTDNALVQRVVASLQEARSRAGQPTTPISGVLPAPSQAPVAQAAQSSSSTAVSGTVSLSASLLARVSPQDTVFIFARAANGGRIPLAAQRIQVKDLPYRFTLDDSKSMSPSAPLSSAAQVVLGARISKSGDAIAQAGDLSGQVGPVSLGTQGIVLKINAPRAP
jgi:cytochrome c-type biogenesis protein CcmH